MQEDWTYRYCFRLAYTDIVHVDISIIYCGKQPSSFSINVIIDILIFIFRQKNITSYYRSFAQLTDVKTFYKLEIKIVNKTFN